MLNHQELYPTLYLDELAYFAYDQFGVWPSKSTVHRRLKEAEISHKAVRFFAPFSSFRPESTANQAYVG